MLFAADSLLESMACAVERASVVLVCFSERYKDSPNCRTGYTRSYFNQCTVSQKKTDPYYILADRTG